LPANLTALAAIYNFDSSAAVAALENDQQTIFQQRGESLSEEHQNVKET
jgi:hypothetical protein